MNSDGAFLLMEDADGVRVEAFPIGGDEVYEFVSTARIGQLEKRYGKKYGKLIAFRKVDTGMTREMVISAWGEPYHKSEVKKEGRTLETLRFSDDTVWNCLTGKYSMCTSIEWRRIFACKVPGEICVYRLLTDKSTKNQGKIPILRNPI